MKKHAFTLIEILVVISIIAILAAIAIPFVQSTIARGHSAKCMENLRDLGAQVQSYAKDKGHYPITFNGNTPWEEMGTWSGITNSSSWLCPARFLKSGKTSSQISSFTPAYTANDRVFTRRGVRVDAVPRPSQVIALIDAGQRMPSGTAFHQMIVTGANNPAHADRPLLGIPITEPNTDITTRGSVRYRHQGSANALFCDGHVESMKLGSILEKNISINY